MAFNLPQPDQQIGFARALTDARKHYLQQALGDSMETVDIAAVDRELARLTRSKSLCALAKKGLRGELLFAVPVLLRSNPRLIAYYRLLLGYSQKEFFTSATGASIFKAGETKGILSAAADAQLEELCAALNAAASALLEGIGLETLSRELLDDLSLLTLGPQLRGGTNNKRGTDAIVRVFDIVHAIVKPAIVRADARSIVIRNAAKREVTIEFAADPDLVIRERMAKGSVRNVVAIEIKGGTDYSNVHNRIGEAEKSHRKARAEGYTECWTVVNVPGLDPTIARKESPTTDRFYGLDALSNNASAEYQDFRNRIAALTGIRLRASKK
jgi:hypothetical protein